MWRTGWSFRKQRTLCKKYKQTLCSSPATFLHCSYTYINVNAREKKTSHVLTTNSALKRFTTEQKNILIYFENKIKNKYGELKEVKNRTFWLLWAMVYLEREICVPFLMKQTPLQLLVWYINAVVLCCSRKYKEHVTKASFTLQAKMTQIILFLAICDQYQIFS